MTPDAEAPAEVPTGRSGSEPLGVGARAMDAWLRWPFAGALLATALGLTAPWFWVGDLFRHYAAHLCVGFALTVTVALARRRRVVAAIALVGVAWHGWPVATSWVSGPAKQAATGEGDAVRVMSFNVRLGNPTPDAVVATVLAADPDVVGFVEVDAGWVARFDAALEAWPHRVDHLRGDCFGVAVYSKHPLESPVVLGADQRMPEAPSAVATVVLPTVGGGSAGREMGFAVVHPEPPTRGEAHDARAVTLRRAADELARRGVPHAMCGDFNLTPFSPHFGALVEATGLRDSRPGFGVHPSWPAIGGLDAVGIPIDHCLVSEGVAVRDRRLGDASGSDHRPVIADLELIGSP